MIQQQHVFSLLDNRSNILRVHVLPFWKPTAVSNRFQDDWAGWIDFTSSVDGKLQTVGDDLTVTNIKRIKRAADEGACNALLLKVGLRSACLLLWYGRVFLSVFLVVLGCPGLSLASDRVDEELVFGSANLTNR